MRKSVGAFACGVALVVLVGCSSPEPVAVSHLKGGDYAGALDYLAEREVLVGSVDPSVEPDDPSAEAWVVESVDPDGDDVFAGDEVSLTLESRLDTAARKCLGGEAEDEGRTLIIDTSGTDLYSGDYEFADLECVLDMIDTPTSVTEHMYSTRALDGRQEDEWGAYAASWSYHPDSGLDVILELAG